MKKIFLIAITAILFLGNIAIAQEVKHYMINDKIVIKTNLPNIKKYEVFYSTLDNNYTKIPDNQLIIDKDKRTIIWTGYKDIDLINLHIKLVATVPTRIGQMKDVRDGKTYKTIKIGTQTWMAENLAYKASSGCWAYDNNSSNVSKYGYLYNWGTAKNVCPDGWHLPSYAEWTTLTDYLGGAKVAGKKLKSANGWQLSGGVNYGNNESGFSALPGGYRYYYDSSFDNVGKRGYWWSSTPSVRESAWIRKLNYDNGEVELVDRYRNIGHSVRCVKNKSFNMSNSNVSNSNMSSSNNADNSNYNNDFDNTVYTVVDQMPEFPGGDIALKRFIAQNVEYPKEARENDIQGTVYLRFVVKKDGSIGKVEIERGVHKLLDDAAIKVVKSLPDFNPGKQGGRNKNVWFSIPVKFRLN